MSLAKRMLLEIERQEKRRRTEQRTAEPAPAPLFTIPKQKPIPLRAPMPLEEAVAACARLCIRPKPSKFASARIAIVMSSMALGDIESVTRWCGGGKIDVIDVGSKSQSIADIVATQVGSPCGTIFCDVNTHAVPFLADALEKHYRYRCCVLMDNPYTFEAVALRRVSGAVTMQMPTVTEKQVDNCLSLVKNESRWILPGMPFDPKIYNQNVRDARSAIHDVYFDYVVSGGVVGGACYRDECLTVAQAMEKRTLCDASDALDYKRVTCPGDDRFETMVRNLDMMSAVCDMRALPEIGVEIAQGLLEDDVTGQRPGRYFRELEQRGDHNRRRRLVNDGDRSIAWIDHAK